MTRHEIPPEDPARAAEWLLAEYDATDIEELADSIGAVQAHRTICVLKTLLDGGSPMRVTAPGLPRSRQVVAVTADTAATAALGPEPITGLGTGATADDTDHLLGRLPRLGTTSSPAGHLLAPDPAPRPHRRHRPRHRRDSPPSTTPPASPAECCTSPAATAARPSARPARPVYKRDARQLVRAGWPAARASPRRSPRTRACSPPSPRRRSARSTPAGCAARPCCPAAPAATPTPGAARTAATSPARPATSRLTPGSASRCAATATTTHAAVLFNAYAGDLWRRFTTYLPRHLARLPGVTQKDLRALVRIRFVKVAEYQARGVVHFHAVIRLDAPARTTSPRPPAITADLLCDAIGLAAAAAASLVEHERPGRDARLRRADRRPAHPPRHDLPGTGQPLDRRGRRQLHRQVRHQDPHRSRRARPPAPARSPTSSGLRCSAHYRRHDHHRLAARQQPRHRAAAVPGLGAHARLRRPLPHQIPPLLRHLRPAPRRPHRPPPRRAPPGRRTRPLGPPPRRNRRPGPARTWTYAGTGYSTATPGAELALSSADMARGH